MYRLLAILLVALPLPTNAGEANLSWTPPTENTDGTPLTDLTSYEVWHGCNQSGAYDTVEVVLAPANAHTALGLPDFGTCYFAVKATNSVGVLSVFSNEAAKVMGSLEIPGTVDDTIITWKESLAVTMLFDASAAQLTLQTASFSWTHTPVGTPKGIIVWVGHNVAADASEDVTGIKYGGVSMIKGAGTPQHLTGAEDVTNYIYYLGSGIPTGAQTVEVTISGTEEYIGVSVSVTAAGDTTENTTDVTLSATSGANPSATFALGSVTSFVVQGWMSGQNNLGAVTEFSGWAADAKQEKDWGGRVMGFWTYDTVGSSDVTIGFTAADDDYNIFAFALKEVAAGGAESKALTLLGVG